MLNFSPDHLDRHPDVDGVRRGEGADLREPGRAATGRSINADDPAVLELARRGRAHAARCSRVAARSPTGTVVEDGWIVERAARTATERLVPLDAIHLLGPHLVNDVMAAATVGAIAGAAPAAMTAAVDAFHGLEHAMELVAEVGGVRFVNDSKATNVEAALRSIESFDAAWCRSSAAGSRAAICGCCASRCGARARRSSRSAKRGRCVREALGGRRAGARGGVARRRGRARVRAGEAGGRGAARAGVRELRHVRDYAERGRRFKEEVRRLIAELRLQADDCER